MRESLPSSPPSVSSDEDYRVEEITKSDRDDSDNEIVQHDGQHELPTFGNVSVMNSNDIHFGNKTVYQGPVTIKQFLYAKENAVENSDALRFNKNLCADGVDNKNFLGDNDVVDKQVKNINVPDNNIAPVDKGFYILHKFPHRKALLLALLTAFIIVVVILLAVLLSRRPSQLTNSEGRKHENEVLGIPPYQVDQNLTLTGKLRMVSRVEWLAQPAVDSTPLKTPVPLVIIHHTATENCSAYGQCVLQTRLIQDFHVQSRQWWDIAYNFLVGGDGSAYEGRGWTKEGSHQFGYNNHSIGIAFIGTFMKYKAPQIQIDACKKLIQQGVDQGYLIKDYKILAARQLQTTESPGLALYEDIMTWPHWSETP
ncbi:unnamed protein product [Brassicogethes aeneus]|uniref:Uncharacterized protein n=1 Tax=Brassicogethes aeneus TaxID=1431903 RepID=A0A9P0FBC9_BRAAE|nr:unnamed protein product [Brassicogethes aeneus]